MTRRIFPNEENRLAYGYTSAGVAYTNKSGSTVTIYTDSAATSLADILTEAGGAIAGSVLTVSADGRMPRFQGPDGTPYGTDTLYALLQGNVAPGEPIYARYDDRLDRDTVVRCTSATRPTSPSDDQLIYETDTERVMRYNLGDTTWYPLADGGPWTAWTPNVTQGNLLVGTGISCQVKKIGRLVHIKGVWTYSSGTSVAGNKILIGNMTFAPLVDSYGHVGSGSVFDSSAGDDITGLMRWDAATTSLQFLSTRANGVLGVVTMAAALAAGDNINFQGAYESTT